MILKTTNIDVLFRLKLVFFTFNVSWLDTNSLKFSIWLTKFSPFCKLFVFILRFAISIESITQPFKMPFPFFKSCSAQAGIEPHYWQYWERSGRLNAERLWPNLFWFTITTKIWKKNRKFWNQTMIPVCISNVPADSDQRKQFAKWRKFVIHSRNFKDFVSTQIKSI